MNISTSPTKRWISMNWSLPKWAMTQVLGMFGQILWLFHWWFSFQNHVNEPFSPRPRAFENETFFTWTEKPPQSIEIPYLWSKIHLFESTVEWFGIRWFDLYGISPCITEYNMSAIYSMPIHGLPLGAVSNFGFHLCPPSKWPSWNPTLSTDCIDFFEDYHPWN